VTKIIANMIGRNESNRFLEDVLKHLRPIVDTIVFTDDASDDDTLSIAKKYGDYVYESIWDDPMFTRNEGILRTKSWSNLENHAEEGDWILAIDCDEKLFSMNNNVAVKEICNNTQAKVINIRFVHMWSETHYRVDKLWRPTNSSRLFRYQSGGEYRNAALACGAEPTYVAKNIASGSYLVDSGLIMQHLGYQRDEDKVSKYERYMELDNGRFHNIDHLSSIVDEDVTLVEWPA